MGNQISQVPGAANRKWLVLGQTELKSNSCQTCCPWTWLSNTAQHPHPGSALQVAQSTLVWALLTTLGSESKGHISVTFPNQKRKAICHSRSNSEPSSQALHLSSSTGTGENLPSADGSELILAQSDHLPLCCSCSWKLERTLLLACFSVVSVTPCHK